MSPRFFKNCKVLVAEGLKDLRSHFSDFEHFLFCVTVRVSQAEMERGAILLVAAVVVFVAPVVRGTSHLSFANDTQVGSHWP